MNNIRNLERNFSLNNKYNMKRGVIIKRKTIKLFKRCVLGILFMILIGLIFPTWTPRIKGENSISQLDYIEINGTKLAVMIRGYKKDNPIIMVVHGGPCCSEIPYIRKYQKELEKKFTIIHYDQRGSGKSYHFLEDYSKISSALLVEDLVKLSQEISKRFNNKQIILMGHSFGTYLSMQAIAQSPELYKAYAGIGQVADQITGELDNLNYCIEIAKAKHNESDVAYLEGLRNSIARGEINTPRNYVRKYGGAARKINETKDMTTGLLFNSEYNLLDTIGYALGVIRFQDILLENQLKNPLRKLVEHVEIPVYFIMGQYDHMTSTAAAQEYFNSIVAPQKEFIIYEGAAHYPQLEEKEKFYNWICDTFAK
ncbi:alpha/beta fold hydrolase [Hathewaya proteolytica]|nr:alpha/beta hydrolase [Hathewaya proteolytica]